MLPPLCRCQSFCDNCYTWFSDGCILCLAGCSAVAHASQQLMLRCCTCAGGRLCPLDAAQEHDGWGSRRRPHAAVPRVRAGDALTAGQDACVIRGRAADAAAASSGSSFVQLTTALTAIPRPAASTQLAGQLQATVCNDYCRAAVGVVAKQLCMGPSPQGRGTRTHARPRCCLKTARIFVATLMATF